MEYLSRKSHEAFRSLLATRTGPQATTTGHLTSLAQLHCSWCWASRGQHKLVWRQRDRLAADLSCIKGNSSELGSSNLQQNAVTRCFPGWSVMLQHRMLPRCPPSGCCFVQNFKRWTQNYLNLLPHRNRSVPLPAAREQVQQTRALRVPSTAAGRSRGTAVSQSDAGLSQSVVLQHRSSSRLHTPHVPLQLPLI